MGTANSQTFCPFCGAPLREKASQCRYCGEMVDRISVEEAKRSGRVIAPWSDTLRSDTLRSDTPQGNNFQNGMPQNGNSRNRRDNTPPPPPQQQQMYQGQTMQKEFRSPPRPAPNPNPQPKVQVQSPGVGVNSNTVFTQRPGNQPPAVAEPIFGQPGMPGYTGQSGQNGRQGFGQTSNYPHMGPFYPNPSWPVRSRILAGILAITLGQFGVHNFYLGQTWMGILHIIFMWTGIPAIAGVIEGILMLCSNDESFMRNNKVRTR